MKKLFIVLISTLYTHLFGMDRKLHTQKAQESFLFSHGIAENGTQAYWYTKGKTNLPHIIDGQLFTFNFPDATTRFWRINFWLSGLGQGHEIATLKKEYEGALARTKNPNQKLILVGMSRGAATVLNFMGKYKPAQVKALVIESPFDSTKSIVKNYLSKFYCDKNKYATRFGQWVISMLFRKHNINGIQPIDSVKKIDRELPILLVCSMQDKVIPVKCTIALYRALINSGHTNVHIFIAKRGRHGRILHGPDGKKYQQVTHAFYKKYGLAHDPNLAQLGKPLLDKSQPDL